MELYKDIRHFMLSNFSDCSIIAIALNLVKLLIGADTNYILKFVISW
jgi:hypothetical protein